MTPVQSQTENEELHASISIGYIYDSDKIASRFFKHCRRIAQAGQFLYATRSDTNAMQSLKTKKSNVPRTED